MTNLVITKDRWDNIIEIVLLRVQTMNYQLKAEYIIDGLEIKMIESVLKSNTPFEVCEPSYDFIENKLFNVAEKFYENILF